MNEAAFSYTINMNGEWLVEVHTNCIMPYLTFIPPPSSSRCLFSEQCVSVL